VKIPDYILGATPCEQTKLKNIFEAGKDSITELLKNPGYLREGGWDLRTNDTPEIVKGEFLEVGNKRYKLIRLYEDGTLILSAAAHNHFLCWGQSTEDFSKHPRLNPIPLIELTYNLVFFYGKLIPYFLKKPSKIRFQIELKNAFLEKSKLHLTPSHVGNTPGWLIIDFWKEAPDNEMKIKLDIPTNSLIESSPYVAYKLIEKLYLWFGFTPDKIPYTTKDDDGDKYIDTQKII
jgi:hypothetical protein